MKVAHRKLWRYPNKNKGFKDTLGDIPANPGGPQYILWSRLSFQPVKIPVYHHPHQLLKSFSAASPIYALPCSDRKSIYPLLPDGRNADPVPQNRGNPNQPDQTQSHRLRTEWVSPVPTTKFSGCSCWSIAHMAWT